MSFTRTPAYVILNSMGEDEPSHLRKAVDAPTRRRPDGREQRTWPTGSHGNGANSEGRGQIRYQMVRLHTPGLNSAQLRSGASVPSLVLTPTLTRPAFVGAMGSSGDHGLRRLWVGGPGRAPSTSLADDRWGQKRADHVGSDRRPGSCVSTYSRDRAGTEVLF